MFSEMQDRLDKWLHRQWHLNSFDIGSIALSPPLSSFLLLKTKMYSKVSALKYIRHLISLVQKEKNVDQKANKQLLNGSSFLLEKRGVAILNLKIIGKLH